MIDTQKLQQKSRLGTILVNRRYITPTELESALAFQSTRGVRLGEALIELGLIDEIQLKRALKRQSWLRTVTTGVALVLAPFSPAFAASQGAAGKSSSASSQISVTILPKTILNGDSSLKFSDSNSTVSESLCLNHLAGVQNAPFMYRVKATGSGQDGAFELTNQSNKSIQYNVDFQHQGKGFETLSAAKISDDYQINNLSKYACKESALNRLRVSMGNDSDKNSSENSRNAFTGTLTLTIAAE